MRSLRSGRHWLRMSGPRTIGTIAHGENVCIARRLQGLRDRQLINPVCLQAVQVAKEIRRLYACCPYDQL